MGVASSELLEPLGCAAGGISGGGTGGASHGLSTPRPEAALVRTDPD